MNNILSNARRCYVKLFFRAAKFTGNIIAIGLTEVDEKTINLKFISGKRRYYKNEFLHEYDKNIEKIAREKHIQFIPTIDLITPELLEDGLHPNIKGHEKIFDRIKGEMVKYRLSNRRSINEVHHL